MRTETETLKRAALPGSYANCFQVGHNAFEFLLDFGQLAGDCNGCEFHTRIIVAPASAQKFSELLRQALARHEREFGRAGGSH